MKWGKDLLLLLCCCMEKVWKKENSDKVFWFEEEVKGAIIYFVWRQNIQFMFLNSCRVHCFSVFLFFSFHFLQKPYFPFVFFFLFSHYISIIFPSTLFFHCFHIWKVFQDVNRFSWKNLKICFRHCASNA